MKRIMLVLLLLTGTFTFTMAQGRMTLDSAAKSKKSAAKVDRAAIAKPATDEKTKTTSTGVNKDGSPDMRMKANKEAKAKQSMPAPAATPAPAKQAMPAAKASPKPASPATATDKVTGKDAKGRTIYEGPKGGQYIINGNGNKEYIKKN